MDRNADALPDVYPRGLPHAHSGPTDSDADSNSANCYGNGNSANGYLNSDSANGYGHSWPA